MDILYFPGCTLLFEIPSTIHLNLADLTIQDGAVLQRVYDRNGAFPTWTIKVHKKTMPHCGVDSDLSLVCCATTTSFFLLILLTTESFTIMNKN